jgi:hypothetical protein
MAIQHLTKETAAEDDEMTKQGWTKSRFCYRTLWTVSTCVETHLDSKRPGSRLTAWETLEYKNYEKFRADNATFRWRKFVAQ